MTPGVSTRADVVADLRAAVRDALLAAARTHARLVLAVSGGIDSMVLLDAANAAAAQPDAALDRRRIVVATFDHGTGPHATQAAAFVAERSQELRFECVTGRAPTALAGEAALRDARWRFLRGIGARVGGAVCTAHTLDDQIETVFMRVLRDAGARGLAALYADSAIVRPLLGMSRDDVVRCAQVTGIRWVEDPSNISRAYLRNRVRHDLLPALRAARPTLDRDLLAVARRAADLRCDIDAYLDRAILPRLRGATGIDIAVASIRDHSRGELAVLWPAVAARVGVALDRRGTVRVAEFSASSRVGSRIQLSGGWEVIRSRDALQLRASSEAKPTPERLSLSEVTSWSDWSFRPLDGTLPDDAWSAHLPSNVGYVVRAWKPGDTLQPRASGRVRKVKELLSEAGITGHQRARWPVVTAEDAGQVVWVPGVRRSDAVADPTGRSGLSFVCEYISR